MTVLAWILALLWGGVVGVASGLLGIGGGVLVVPFLYLLFGAGWSGMAADPATATVVAHATSLFVVLPTALSGLREYGSAGMVRWPVVLPMGIAAAVSAALAARWAVGFPPELLRGLFGLLLVTVGLRMWPRKRSRDAGKRMPGPMRTGTPLLVVAGAAVGTFSAVLGVGGGVVAIPLLLYLVRMDMDLVAATSIGVVAFAAPAGVLSYAVSGWGAPGLPPGTVGFVHLPSALLMIPTAIVMARLGARWNQRMDGRQLQYIFGILFLLLGGRLLWGGIAALGSAGV
jgi:uncharacterized protein